MVREGRLALREADQMSLKFWISKENIHIYLGSKSNSLNVATFIQSALYPTSASTVFSGASFKFIQSYMLAKQSMQKEKMKKKHPKKQFSFLEFKS